MKRRMTLETVVDLPANGGGDFAYSLGGGAIPPTQFGIAATEYTFDTIVRTAANNCKIETSTRSFP